MEFIQRSARKYSTNPEKEQDESQSRSRGAEFARLGPRPRRQLQQRPETPDWQCVEGALALGDLAEPLGFDGIWFPEHCGTPYGMTPNPIQALTYFAGRTERVGLGTFVAVAPWWNPVRLAHQIAYLDIVSKGRYNTIGIGRVCRSPSSTPSASRARRAVSGSTNASTSSSWRSAESGSPTTARSSRSPRCRCARSRTARTCSRASTARPRLRVAGDPVAARHGAAVRRQQADLGCRAGGAEGQHLPQEEGFAPCQPKNVMFMYCMPDEPDAEQTDEWIRTANRDVTVHYGFADASNFKGVKGYEAYAPRSQRDGRARRGRADGEAGTRHEEVAGLPRVQPADRHARHDLRQAQGRAGGVLVLRGHDRPPVRHHAVRRGDRELKLFANEVLPAVHEMAAPLHEAALPAEALA